MKMPEERHDISMKALLLQTKMDILPVLSAGMAKDDGASW
jgi:hypothetical protein